MDLELERSPHADGASSVRQICRQVEQLFRLEEGELSSSGESTPGPSGGQAATFPPSARQP